MKACVIQPPYSMDYSKSEEYFKIKADLLEQCDESMDIIVLPEYSDVPCCAKTTEENLESHKKYITPLLELCSKTAKRCNAILFVNALCLTDEGYKNTTYAYSRNGELVGKYYKKHIPIGELNLDIASEYTREFSEPTVMEIEGIRFGFLTCYDFYFYEAFPTIARQNVDVIIGCSLQRSDTHSALEIMGRFLAYNTNSYLLRASVSLDGSPDICGASMIITPKGDVLVNMKSDIGLGIAEFDPKDKYYKPAGFGNPPAPHYEYIEDGRNPWQYRPAGSAIIKPESLMPYPRICAHRGFSTIAPENSMPAFGAAVGMGAEEIEFDLWYTKDGEIVSVHDDTLDRISNGTGYVYDHTYEELKKLDFGIKHGEKFKGLRVVKFEDILEKFSCHVIMNIHIKPDVKFDAEDKNFDKKHLEKIISLIDKYDCRKYVYFMSSNDTVLGYLKELAPDIPLCCGFDFNPDFETIVDRAIKFGCKKVQFFKPNYNENMIKKAHEHGIICNMFWSDEPDEAVKFIEMGIDTILTNDYNIVANAVKNGM